MSPSLWSPDEIAQATKGALAGHWQREITGVSIDTRSLLPGDFFIALGAVRDGHDFVADALLKGASGAMVSKRPEGLGADAPLLMVSNVQEGLEALARAARSRAKAQVIAVTGSAGKTSTKDMLKTMLSRQGKTHASRRSFNNHLGVPLTLATLSADADFALIEIGMNSPGEIAPLARLTRPHIGLITIVGSGHLAGFDTVADIAHEKAAIFAAVELGGGAIFNGDIEHSEILASIASKAGLSALRFGAEKHNDLYLETISISGAELYARYGGVASGEFHLCEVTGRHFALNALGALAAVAAVGGDKEKAAQALSSWRPDMGRGARRQIFLASTPNAKPVTLIDDTYNANPVSMSAALDVLAEADGRRVAVLGDMLELGEAEYALHAALADMPAIAKIDLVHTAGPRMGALWQALAPEKRGLNARDSAELAKHVGDAIAPGDTVLVKGSFGSRMAIFIDALDKLSQANK